MKVLIKLQKVDELPIAAILDYYIARGSSVDKPQDQVNALNIILGNKNTHKTFYIFVHFAITMQLR